MCETKESQVIEEKTQNGKKITLKEHIVEIVSDAGEGAQKCGQCFGAISAKMGNGVWTVEIIPAEIQPPARSREGASGIRIRFGDHPISNMGDEADLVIAFNEQVLYGRISTGAYKKGTIILLENKWKNDKNEKIRQEYQDALKEFEKLGYIVVESPFEEEMLKVTPNAKRGKNMFALGVLCSIYNRNLELAEEEIAFIFRQKSKEVIELNLKLLHQGYKWAEENLPYKYEIRGIVSDSPYVVMNGNEALSFGIMSAGIELCAMYPITPATSASHHLAEYFEKVGGKIHQAEDEIAAIGFAIGASYAGKTAVTITSGPGMALKTEFIGLAVMAEIPLVIVDVQRGGPSTGLPTKVEQSDLFYAVAGQPGDCPKIVIAPSTIEECFYFPIMARQIAEAFRIPVIILSDANLATGVQPFKRPRLKKEWFAAPIDQSPWNKDILPYDWDEKTGLSKRPLPGQAGGAYTLTGLAHDEHSHVAYTSKVNQKSHIMRSRKLNTFYKTLKKPEIYGEEKGDILLVGWGSTKGAIEEAVDKLRKEKYAVSSTHLHFLSPLQPGLKEMFSNFKKVVTVEINYSDEVDEEVITEDNRRYSQLAWLLRAKTLVDVDCISNVFGQPMSPKWIIEKTKKKFETL